MTSMTKVVARGTAIAMGTAGVPARSAMGTTTGTSSVVAAALAIKLVITALIQDAPAATTGQEEPTKIGNICEASHCPAPLSSMATPRENPAPNTMIGFQGNSARHLFQSTTLKAMDTTMNSPPATDTWIPVQSVNNHMKNVAAINQESNFSFFVMGGSFSMAISPGSSLILGEI
jgi:hypothetical protein